jgi:hypothetical protein
MKLKLLLLLILTSLIIITSCISKREIVFNRQLPITLGITVFEKEEALENQKKRQLLFYWDLNFFELSDLMRMERLIINQIKSSGAFLDVDYPASGQEEFVLLCQFEDLSYYETFPKGYEDFSNYELMLKLHYRLFNQDNQEVLADYISVSSEPGIDEDVIMEDLIDETVEEFYYEVYDEIYPKIEQLMAETSTNEAQ